MMRKCITVLLLIPLSFVVKSQSFYAIRHERSLIAIGGIGTSSYFGELKNPGNYLDAKPTLSAGLQMYFTNRISVRSELTYFSLKGDDAKADDRSRVRRNLSFTSGNFELNFVGMFNLFPLGKRFYQRPNVNFYGFAGIGLMYMNPKAEYQGKKYALQPLKTEDVAYSRLQPVIPYGLGIRVKAGPFFNVALEGGWRTTFTDYMDDVSGAVPDKSSWDQGSTRYILSDRRREGSIERGEDPLLDPYPAGTIRGNPDKKDNYFLLTLKVEYYLPNNFLFKNPNRKLYNAKRKAYYR